MPGLERAATRRVARSGPFGAALVCRYERVRAVELAIASRIEIETCGRGGSCGTPVPLSTLLQGCEA